MDTAAAETGAEIGLSWRERAMTESHTTAGGPFSQTAACRPLAPLSGKAYGAFLFDMDGTLLTSLAAAERVWARWAEKHGLDVARFLPTIHGQRAIDTVQRQGLTGIDPVAEAQWVLDEELLDVEGVTPIAGAMDFLRTLPADRWALVTSAPASLARVRLEAAGLPVPARMVTAESVERGKPDPACFRAGAALFGLSPADCLVFEDAPAGITAAEASGADVVVITATHRTPLETRHMSIPSYGRVQTDILTDGRVRLRVPAETR